MSLSACTYGKSGCGHEPLDSRAKSVEDCRNETQPIKAKGKTPKTCLVISRRREFVVPQLWCVFPPALQYLQLPTSLSCLSTYRCHTHFIYAFHPTSSLPVPSPQDWNGRRGAHEVSFGIPLGYPRQGI